MLAPAAGARCQRPPSSGLPLKQDKFIGWECAGQGGGFKFWTFTTDYSQGKGGGPGRALRCAALHCAARRCTAQYCAVECGTCCFKVLDLHQWLAPPSCARPAEGEFVRERTLCLLGRVDGDDALSYNYTLAEDGCPARWVPRQ